MTPNSVNNRDSTEVIPDRGGAFCDRLASFPGVHLEGITPAICRCQSESCIRRLGRSGGLVTLFSPCGS
jgi:hypothetical protein